MNKIIGLILVASLSACGDGGGGGGGVSSSSDYSAPLRSDLTLSESQLSALSTVEFSSVSVTGFVAPSNSN